MLISSKLRFGGLPAVTVENTNTPTYTSSSTASGLDFGAARADRIIVVPWIHRGDSQVSNIVIGGITAGYTWRRQERGGTGDLDIGVAWAKVPTGTSGSVVFSGIDKIGLSVWRLLNATTTGRDIYGNESSGTSESSLSTTNVSVPKRGALIGSFGHFSDPNTISISTGNVTIGSNYQYPKSGEESQFADGYRTGEMSSQTVTMSASSMGTPIMVMVSFHPEN